MNRSPINYIGNKNKLIGVIKENSPNDIDVMHDVFCGSGVVSLNIDAKKNYLNDINTYIIGLLKDLGDIQEEDIDSIISKYELSKTNREGFIELREEYNNIVGTPVTKEMSILLYTLLCYSYNNQFRFNNNFKYNSSFGLNRSDFNDRLRSRLNEYHDITKNKDLIFINKGYDEYLRDNVTEESFIYLDPPYLITTGNYNDGKRGFGMWNKDDDKKLFYELDRLGKEGHKFMLSNVTHHKGNINEELIKFGNRYNVVEVKADYSNASYNTKETSNLVTREVLIMNY